MWSRRRSRPSLRCSRWRKVCFICLSFFRFSIFTPCCLFFFSPTLFSPGSKKTKTFGVELSQLQQHPVWKVPVAVVQMTEFLTENGKCRTPSFSNFIAFYVSLVFLVFFLSFKFFFNLFVCLFLFISQASALKESSVCQVACRKSRLWKLNSTKVFFDFFIFCPNISVFWIFCPFLLKFYLLIYLFICLFMCLFIYLFIYKNLFIFFPFSEGTVDLKGESVPTVASLFKLFLRELPDSIIRPKVMNLLLAARNKAPSDLSYDSQAAHFPEYR